MTIAKTLPQPQRWINGYLREKLSEYSDTGVSNDDLGLDPFFPAQGPMNFDMVYDALAQTTPSPTLFQYDRLLRLRKSPFYAIKKEQGIYFFFAETLERIMNVNLAVSQLLDREDISAQEINEWASKKQSSQNPLKMADGTPYDLNVFFHNLRIFQVDESRDIADLSSVRTLYRNKFIIEYDYHVKVDPSLS